MMERRTEDGKEDGDMPGREDLYIEFLNCGFE